MVNKLMAGTELGLARIDSTLLDSELQKLNLDDASNYMDPRGFSSVNVLAGASTTVDYKVGNGITIPQDSIIKAGSRIGVDISHDFNYPASVEVLNGLRIPKEARLANDVTLRRDYEIKEVGQLPIGVNIDDGKGTRISIPPYGDIPIGSIIKSFEDGTGGTTNSYTIDKTNTFTSDIQLPVVVIPIVGYKPGNNIVKNTALSTPLTLESGSVFLEDSFLPVDIEVTNRSSGTRVTIPAGDPIPAGSKIHSTLTIPASSGYPMDFTIPKLGYSLELSTDYEKDKCNFVEGSFLPVGIMFAEDVEVFVAPKRRMILTKGTPTSPDMVVAKHICVDSVLEIKSGDPLPIDITTGNVYTTTRPSYLVAGFTPKSNISLNAKSISYSAPSTTYNSLKGLQPEEMFKELYMKDSLSSPLNDATYSKVMELIALTIDKPNSSYYQAKIYLTVAESFMKIPLVASALSSAGTTFDQVKKDLEDLVKEKETDRANKDGMTQVGGIGKIIEEKGGVFGGIMERDKDYKDNVEQEITGTQNKIRAEVSRKIETCLDDVDKIDTFNVESNDALEKGFNLTIDRLEDIYRQRVNYRKNNLGLLDKGIGKLQKMNWKGKLAIGLGATASTVVLGAATGGAIPIAHVIIQATVLNSLAGKRAWAGARKLTASATKRNAINIESQIREITSSGDSDKDPFATEVKSNMEKLLNDKVQKSLKAEKSKFDNLKQEIQNTSNTAADRDRYLKTYQKLYADTISKAMEDFYEEQFRDMVKQRNWRNVHRATEALGSVALRSLFATATGRTLVSNAVSGLSNLGRGSYNILSAGASRGLEALSEGYDFKGSNLMESSNWKKAFAGILDIPDASAETIIKPSVSDTSLADASLKTDTTTVVNKEVNEILKQSTEVGKVPSADTPIGIDKSSVLENTNSATADSPIDTAKITPQETMTELTKAYSPELPATLEYLGKKDFVEPAWQIPEIPKEGVGFRIPGDEIKIPKSSGNGSLLDSLLGGKTLRDSDPTFRQIIDTVTIGGKELSYQDKTQFMKLMTKSNPGLTNYIFNDQEIVFSSKAIDFLHHKTGLGKDVIFSRIRTPENFAKFVGKLWELKK